MSEDESQSVSAGRALVSILEEGGLPQVIAGPAGKALSRLIGEAADIPAAWLQRYSQGIRDETKARSLLKSTVAAAAAKRAAKNTDILDRTIISTLGDGVRAQANKEKIAEKTFEHLKDEPPPADSPGPSDDWLNVFSDHAARASSERLQETWSRVLAGEIRQPGAFSYQTLQFISLLDPKIAGIFESFAREALMGDFIINPLRFDFTPRFNDLNLMQEYGLVHLGQQKKFNLNKGIFPVTMSNWMMMLEREAAQPVTVQSATFTQVGREIYSILSPVAPIDQARSIAKIVLASFGGNKCGLFELRLPSPLNKETEAGYAFVEEVTP